MPLSDSHVSKSVPAAWEQFSLGHYFRGTSAGCLFLLLLQQPSDLLTPRKSPGPGSGTSPRDRRMGKCLANSKQVWKASSSTVHTLVDDDSNADLISPSAPCLKMPSGRPLLLGRLPKSLSLGDAEWFGPWGPPWHPLLCLPLWPRLSFSFLARLVSFGPKGLFFCLFWLSFQSWTTI